MSVVLLIKRCQQYEFHCTAISLYSLEGSGNCSHCTCMITPFKPHVAVVLAGGYTHHATHGSYIAPEMFQYRPFTVCIIVIQT